MKIVKHIHMGVYGREGCCSVRDWNRNRDLVKVQNVKRCL